MNTSNFSGTLAVAAACSFLAVSSVSAQSVENLWNNNCAACHGKGGEGGGAGTRSLLTKEARAQDLDRRFFDSIKSGVPTTAMGPFGGTMSDKQIWGLVVYLRELQHRAYRESGGKPEAQNGVFTSQHHEYRVETVINKGLDTPWAVDWLPTGEMIVTERPGEVRLFAEGKLSAPIKGTPEVLNDGQGGMMDVAVHPDAAKNGWVFLAFSDPGKTSKRAAMTKVVRGKITRGSGGAWEWTDQITVFEASQDHYVRSGVHFGCRIAFDPKDSSILFFSIGERGIGERSPDLARPNGKVHRVTVDGKTPPGNPFAGNAKALETVWSYGHRNPQGLVFDLQGNLWDTEHGPRGGDELNIVLKGRNYGWPTWSFGINYDGSPYRTPWQDAPANGEQPIVMPTYRWMPSIGACGLDVCRAGPKGEAFPKWRGDLFAGGLSGEDVDRLRVKVSADGTTELVEREEILFDMGRVRDVVTGPEGAIYVVLNVPDKVVRIVPAK